VGPGSSSGGGGVGSGSTTGCGNSGMRSSSGSIGSTGSGSTEKFDRGHPSNADLPGGFVGLQQSFDPKKQCSRYIPTFILPTTAPVCIVCGTVCPSSMLKYVS